MPSEQLIADRRSRAKPAGVERRAHGGGFDPVAYYGFDPAAEPDRFSAHLVQAEAEAAVVGKVQLPAGFREARRRRQQFLDFERVLRLRRVEPTCSWRPRPRTSLPSRRRSPRTRQRCRSPGRPGADDEPSEPVAARERGRRCMDEHGEAA